jgi:ribosome-binding protein aMBF1 (putative translation factor)
VLQRVREAKKTAADARSTPGLTPDQRKLLEDLYVDLDKQEDTLIMEAIDQKLAALREAANRLEVVAQVIAKETDKLKKVAEVVDKAAKALKILADITAKAGSLGIL